MKPRSRSRKKYSRIKRKKVRNKSSKSSKNISSRRKLRSKKKIFIINKPSTIFDFKIIELEGCRHCQDAKKLILSKKYTLKVKKDLSLEEENEIKSKVGDYPYFPKIFKYNKTNRKYEFIGGYDKLLKSNI